MNKRTRPRLLVVTTIQDKSAPLLLTQRIKEAAATEILLYEESARRIASFCRSHTFDYIYLRDPFPSRLSTARIRRLLEAIFSHYQSHSHFIDNLQNVEDVWWEDKWRQYQTLADLMPKTQLLTDALSPAPNTYIIKKRLSSRSRDIFFNTNQIKISQKYIIQEKLPIATEYKVMIVRGRVLPIALVKSVKGPAQPARVIGTQKIDYAVTRLATTVHQRCQFDLVGIDMARLPDGTHKIIEVNRSPQTNKYFEMTGINLLEMLLLKTIQSN